MEWWLVLLILFSSFGVLLVLGMPVAFSFLFLNLIGAYFIFGGEPGLMQLIVSIFDSVSKFTFLPVPLFILMGEIMFRSGIGMRAIDTLGKWLGRVPGRLSLIAVAGGTLLSATSGSSMATTAMLGSLLVPEMEQRGYKKPMSVGPILGSGGLAMIIPPTALGVLLASIAYISVGKLLMAGFLPGILIAFFYASYIIIRCRFQPSLAPSYDVAHTPLSEKLNASVRYILPLGFIFFLVVGFIFLGIATPSESAAIGVIGTLILAALYRNLNWDLIRKSFSATIEITIMMLMIIAGSTGFSQILAFSGAGTGLTQLVVGIPLTPLLLIVAMQILIIVLGCFMDQVSIMMITLPIYMPIVANLGFDPVWFGLLMLINVEMAATTPPFGMVLFVMKSVAPPDTTTGDLYRGALPFLACDAVAMALIMVFPQIALWLPNVMT